MTKIADLETNSFWSDGRKFYTVKFRREAEWIVKPNAEQIEGKTFLFEPGWIIDEIDHYNGEIAMIPLDDHYPESAPVWIASGDLTNDVLDADLIE